MANNSLSKAKTAKNDEFYTQYSDIEKEINAYLEYDPNVFKGKTILLPCDDPEWSNFTKYFAQNFTNFGLKKLISTSYSKTSKYGKIFILTHDTSNDGKVDVNDFEWDYMKGDGDFRSDEVKQLRDEADIIITNPPFSLFREFLTWIVEAEKQFVIIGNLNAITYKKVFPLIKENKLWLGATGKGRVFGVPKGTEVGQKDKEKAAKLGYVGDYTTLGNTCWYTNIDHGRRNQPLPLMTMADNLKFSKHKKVKEQGYKKYDNYDAIEVPFTDAIPSDYPGEMGVPITFMDKFCPEQFEIVGSFNGSSIEEKITEHYVLSNNSIAIINGKEALWNGPIIDKKALYKRIVIKLMTMEDNIKYSRHKEIKGNSYQKYDNYDAIEVPYTDAIPSDYDGIMGVPISFLNKYSPDQFDIVGMCENEDLYKLKTKVYTTDECKQAYIAKFGKKGTYDLNASGVVIRNGLYESVYQRVLIKHKTQK